MYAELRCKTNRSFLEGASHPREYVERAAELGLAALAITDRNGVYGIPEAYTASKAHPGLKLLVGAELTLGADRLTLLAQTRQGYGLLCRMLTESHADQEKGQASLAWERFTEMMNLPGAGALVAIPPPSLLETAPPEKLETLKDLFGPKFYLPLIRVLDGRDHERTERTLVLARRLGAGVVATNDVHYHVETRRMLQDVLAATRAGLPLSKAGTKLFSNSERYLKSPAQMAMLFQDLPEALSNTLEVADSCSFKVSELRYRYPSEWIPSGETAQGYLEGLARKGASWRYPQGVPDAIAKLIDHELKLIRELEFADYFLTVWDIVEFARGKGILCQGRGSAANSVVCYALGITAIDPAKIDLLFERFISAERGEPPDIDVDFEHERREEVIQYIYAKYGRDRAAMVAAVITYRDRLARREICKALEIDLEPPPGEENTPRARTADFLTEEIYGFPRHLSIHSGGFTLSADPIIETVPVEPARMEGRTIVQWDKYDLDAVGLLKIDVLALGMLSALRKTMDLIAERPSGDGGGLTLATIPPDDPATYKMIQEADTVGTFQIESRAQMAMLPRLLPKTFYDLTVQVAIVRPGPIVGKMIHPYLKRRKGLEPVDMPDPRLVPILGKTYGVPIFQEQVMKMAIVVAGFTPGEADALRRAIGAWRSSGSIDQLGRKLMLGLQKAGLPAEFTERIFQQIHGFAEYGFPESHAASFALIAYASAYLRCHYPAEFACSLINSQPMGFYSVHTLVDDAKRHGVGVEPLHPNLSGWDCAIEASAPGNSKGAIRLGFGVVHGLPQAAAAKLVADREARGPFTSLADFISRAGLRANVLQTLARGEAFACFGYDQRQALWEILSYRLSSCPEPSGQLNLFTALSGGPSPMFGKLAPYDTIRADYDAYGCSTRGHPMQALRKLLPAIPDMTSERVKGFASGRMVRASGVIIVRQRPPTAGGVCFATLEDEHGFLDLILHKEVFERYQELFLYDSVLTVHGKVQRDGNAVSILAKEFSSPIRGTALDLEQVPKAGRNFH